MLYITVPLTNILPMSTLQYLPLIFTILLLFSLLRYLRAGVRPMWHMQWRRCVDVSVWGSRTTKASLLKLSSSLSTLY